MTKTLTRYFNNQTFNEDFLNELNVKLHIQNNPYNLPLGSLFSMGARKNPKRNFLFVSKLLGKHIPVQPQIPKLTGLLLANEFLKTTKGQSEFNSELLVKALLDNDYLKTAIENSNNKYVSLDKETLFLGFAETATGLGHAMYDAFSENAHYIHTTREMITDLNSSFNFEEEHSHATSHLCFALDPNYFDRFERIVLVDDEVTTGNTALNLIRALNSKYPNKEYYVASLLDWRKQEEIENYKKAEKELGISIKSISLLSGYIEYTNKQMSFEEVSYPKVDNNHIQVKTVLLPVLNEYKLDLECQTENGESKIKLYYQLSGRFGIESSMNQVIDNEVTKFAKILQPERLYSNTLCTGFGEYIYIPSLIASQLEGEVVYHSMSRSPIFALNKENYPIKNIVSFPNPEDKSFNYNLYNITPNEFDEVIIFLERDIDNNSKELIAQKLEDLGVKSLIFAALS